MPLKPAILLLSASLLAILHTRAQAPQREEGRLAGNVTSADKQALAGVTVSLQSLEDSLRRQMTVSDESGQFEFSTVPLGMYRLRLTAVGHAALRIDSIRLQTDRPIVQLNDLVMSAQGSGLETIVIYASRPLIETKDGNIVFNAVESPLSSGSSAAELLKTLPLVSSDPDGKVTLRGREPRILIDDKPVEMNAQQMQDFLESMPGGMIEKIEVMTNPPPQYANEPGGVINIVTRRGKVGWNGRLSVNGGTRGEAGASVSFNYRRKGLSLQFNAGDGYSRIQGSGSGIRQNRYADSTNRLLTSSAYDNRSERPNMRLNVDYEVAPRNTLSLTLQANDHHYDNANDITYANENADGIVWRRSTRRVLTEGRTRNPSASLNYTLKGKRTGEELRFIGSYSRSPLESLKDFRQVYYDGKMNPTGRDSAQEQAEQSRNHSMQARLSYDFPVKPDATILSGSFSWTGSRSDVTLDTYDKEPGGARRTLLPLLSNAFGFRQDVLGYRISVRQKLAERLWLSTGLVMQGTTVHFDLIRDAKEYTNRYVNWTPYANLNKNWNGKTTLSLVYRRTIDRPGIRELNPAIDYTDPYNLRFGNPDLLPASAHNFDLNFGRNSEKLSMNGGLGYNRVEDVFAIVRTLREQGKTSITWENISGRREFEVNGWMGYNLSRKLRMNLNASYSYNRYDEADVLRFRYRNGASANTRLHVGYTPNNLLSLTTNLQFNRYANPQGTVRSTVNMVFGGQYKFFGKRLIVNLQAVDPFIQQNYRTQTEGLNFTTQSSSLSRTRNYRLTLTWAFSNMPADGRRRKEGQKAVQPAAGRRSGGKPLPQGLQ